MANGEGKLLSTLKSVGTFLGVVGGGGAGFAGLAFGIGYLAMKHHDAMLGMPTTTTDNSSYVRTGALFFTQSLHDLVEALATAATPSALWIIGIATVVAALLVAFKVGNRIEKLLPANFTQRVFSTGSIPVLLVGSVALLLVAIQYLPQHLAPLDIGNKNLLFEQRAVTGGAKQVLDLLRSEEGEQPLHRLYGLQLVIVLILGLAALLLYRWRRSHKTGTGSSEPSLSLVIMDWVVHPALFAVITAMVISLPANYGVLAMSTSLPCVHLYAAPTRSGDAVPIGDPGFLFSDLSSEAATVSILRWDLERKSYYVDLHPRSDLKQLEVRACAIRTPLTRVPGARLATATPR